MKKTIVGLVLLAASAYVSAQIAYPGSNWSNVTYNSNPVRVGDENVNTLLQGNVEQGVVWAEIGSGWRLNTYTSVGYSIDTLGLVYNNKITPTLGVKLQRPWSNGNWDVGIQAVYQINFRDNFNVIPSGVSNSGAGVQAYVQYWTGWDLKR